MSINRALSLTDDPSKVLGLKVGPHEEIKPGQYIGRADAQTPPELSLPTASPNTTYLAINIDIDAPFPSIPVLGPILHWIQPGLRADVASGTLKTTAPFVANYIGPAPPPGSAPHRYVFLLYEQPEGFDGAEYAPAGGKELSNWYRIRYDLESWEKTVGLGEVVGVNYFVSN